MRTLVRIRVPGATSALILFMVALVLSSPQRPGDPAGALAPGGRGLIAGQVVDPGTGKPVSEALVTLRVSSVTDSGSPRVLADAQGRFVFVNVPAGRYDLQTQKLGYLPSVYGQRIPNERSGTIDLADGQVLTDLVAPMWKYSAIGGTVTDEAGQPVVGVRVEPFKKAFEAGEIRLVSSDPYGSQITDDRGMYRLSNLAPGEYAVAVPSTLATFPVDAMSAIRGGSSAVQLAAAMNELAPLGDPQNQQVGDHVLLINRRTAIPPAPSGNNLTSVYRTTFAPDTPLSGQATIVSLGSGEERSGVNITLRPSRAVRVAGRLVGPDGPIVNTALRLITIGQWRISAYQFDSTATAVTDAAGRFTMLGVPEGEYTVNMKTGDPTVGVISTSQAVVVVGDSDVTDLVVTARRAARLTGHFEIRSGQPPPTPGFLFLAGDSIAGVYSFALGPRGAGMDDQMLVPPGSYALSLHSPSNLPCSSVLANRRDVSDELFVLGNDDVDLTVVCGEATTRLSGTVRNQSGAVETDAAIVIFPSDRRFWSGAEIRPRRFQQTYTDKAGGFSLVNLPAGDYLVAAIPISQSDLWQDPKTLDVVARSATHTTIATGDARSVDLKLVRIR